MEADIQQATELVYIAYELKTAYLRLNTTNLKHIFIIFLIFIYFSFL